MSKYRIVKNEKKWYEDQNGTDAFKIQVRFLFFFWINITQKNTFNLVTFWKIEDAELYILELQK